VKFLELTNGVLHNSASIERLVPQDQRRLIYEVYGNDDELLGYALASAAAMLQAAFVPAAFGEHGVHIYFMDDAEPDSPAYEAELVPIVAWRLDDETPEPVWLNAPVSNCVMQLIATADGKFLEQFGETHETLEAAVEACRRMREGVLASHKSQSPELGRNGA
jgi:hypothetical protein